MSGVRVPSSPPPHHAQGFPPNRVNYRESSRNGTRGHSSAGRASRWQREGQEFESPCLHQCTTRLVTRRAVVFLLYCAGEVRWAIARHVVWRARVRKVRASQGKVQDNVLSGQPEGKCHRNIPPQELLEVHRESRGPRGCAGGAQVRSTGVSFRPSGSPRTACSAQGISGAPRLRGGRAGAKHRSAFQTVGVPKNCLQFLG